MNNLNPVTISALLAWPAVAIWLYRTRPIGRATLWTILGGYMLLPVAADIKFPMIPAFDKNSIPIFAALFGCAIICRRSITPLKGFGLTELLILMLITSPFVTCELNGDPVFIGGKVLPGLDSYEAGSVLIAQVVSLIPFFLGRQFLCSKTDTEEILRVLVIAGLIYSLFSLFEVRFSPQLHAWIYGYFPMAGSFFEQQVRDGGFRPVVFLGHGLLVAFFTCTSAVAAVAFWRTKARVMRKIPLPSSGIVAYLCFVLVLCKTASSLAYGIVLVPLVRFTAPKMQLNFAALLVAFTLLYPTLRVTGLFPINTALDLASSYSQDRGDSLATRFMNEDQLLERTSQRLMFGWGRWGRGWIYDEQGNFTSALDGIWIITLDEFGFVGFLALFGLLSLPVFNAALALRFAESFTDKLYLSALALILAINIFDLIPNSPLRPWTWLVAGALLGRAEALRERARLLKNSKIAIAASPSRSLR
jgi:hypothetical protein